MSRERSPGIKLLFTILVGMALIVPLVFVYALVNDRQHQSRVAQQSITAGWGGSQVISGPVLAIPYMAEREQLETVDGRTVTRTVRTRDEIYLSPQSQAVSTDLQPEKRSKSIYESVIYLARLGGQARFALPEDLSGLGLRRDQLLLDEVEVRFGASDPRGLQTDTRVTANGEALSLDPGHGPAASNGSGFHGQLDWSEGDPLTVDWSYSLRGSHGLSLVPRGGETEWTVTSSWPHPNFGGSFVPDAHEIGSDGFTAVWSFTNLALGQALVMEDDLGAPYIEPAGADAYYVAEVAAEAGGADGKAASIRLVEPVDLYSQVDRSVKYGFLFIGFTFLAFLMFDLVGGARVAAAEYLLTGTGLVLFFVMLLAFAEVIGFTLAYVFASAAIIGLLTAYSAAVLSSWRRAAMIGGLLTGLYVTLYTLLSLEAWSLMIGSLLLFVALAAVMYATRNIDWSSVRKSDEEEGRFA